MAARHGVNRRNSLCEFSNGGGIRRITPAKRCRLIRPRGLAEQMYAKDQAIAGAEAGGQAPGAGPGKKDDDVVDAEFEEVKDK
jgi:hypothetical protein